MVSGVDGSIRIDTKIDAAGFNSGVKNINTGVAGVTKSLKNLALAVGIAFSVKAVYDFAKASVAASTDMENALMGLQSIMEGQNRSFQKSKKFINEYISDGLIPATKAITAYKNLALRGYSDDQIQQVLVALKDSAAFGRQASYTLGEAVETATEGLKNENSILVDNAGVTKNVAKMWDDYAKSIGTTSNNLTQQEKIQAEVSGILEETKYQMGDAALIADSYSGQVLRLQFALTNLKIAVGDALKPLLKSIIPAITELVNWFTILANKISQISALLFGKSVTANTKTADSAAKASTSTDELAESTENAGNAAEKAAKQANGAVAAFDKLNVLQTDSSSSSSGSDSAGGSGVSAESVMETTTEIEEGESATSEWITRLQELADLFKTGFHFGKGSSFNARIEDIKLSLQKIKDILKDIFNDPEVSEAAKRYFDSLALNAGIIAGSFVSIGVTIAQNVVGGIKLFLEQNSETIKDYLVEMFDIGTRINDILGNFSAAFAYIFEAFGSENGQQLTANIIGLFAEAFMGLTSYIGEVMIDVLEAITKPFIDNKEKIRTTVEEALGEVADGFGYLKETVHDVFVTMKDLYKQYFKPVIKNLGEIWSDVFTNYILPLVTDFSELWTAACELVKTLWEQIIKPFLEWLAPKSAESMEAIGVTVLGLVAITSDAIGDIINLFTDIISFIDNVFKGDWKAAWIDIKNIFGDIFGDLIDVAKKPINAIIKMINGLISGIVMGINAVVDSINAIGFTIPKWVPKFGGESIGFDISHVKSYQIPLLATGAVIPPNQQFMAILGDQKNGRNLEAPEGLIRQIMQEELAGLSDSGNMTVEMPVYLDGELIYKNQKKVARRHGTRLVTGGI